MKRIAFLLLFAAAVLLLAVSASAGTVMYQGGGANGLYRTGYSGAINVELHFNDEPFNLSDADCLYLRVYIDEPERYTNNGQIEITSSGRCDAEEYSWDVNSFDMQQGWNEWQIDLYTGNESGGAPDMEKINYFRMYFFTEGDNLIAIDYVAFGGENEDFSSIATELGEVKREVHVPENRIQRVGKGSSGSVYMEAVMDATPVNIADYDCAFLRFKVDGIDHFTGDGQLEFTSSLSPDQKEMNWLVSGLDLEDGWNEIKLDLYAPDSLGGDFDYEKVSYFRLYMFTEGGVLKLNLDYIGFGYENDEFGYDLPLYMVVSEDAPELTPEEQAAREEAQRIAAEERAAQKAAEAERIAAEEAAKKAEEERIAAEEAAKKAEEEEAARLAAEEAAKPEQAAEAETPAAGTSDTVPAESGKTGCGSFIGGGALVLIAVIGAAWIGTEKSRTRN